MPRHNFTGSLSIDYEVIEKYKVGLIWLERLAREEHQIDPVSELPENHERRFYIEDSHSKKVATYNNLQKALDNLERTALSLDLPINERHLEWTKRWLEDQKEAERAKAPKKA